MLHMILPELVLNTIICLGGRGYASYGPSRASSEYYYLLCGRGYASYGPSRVSSE